MKVLYYFAGLSLFMLTSRYAQAVEHAYECDYGSFNSLPEKYSVALGYGLSRRPLFGQESVYRESVIASVSAYWSCIFVNHCSILVRAGYLEFLGIPGPVSSVNVEQGERRYSAGLGLESTVIVPIGFSFGASEVVRSYQYRLNSELIGDSGQDRWRESGSKAVLDVWFGVPLVPDLASLNLTLSRFLTAQSPEDNSVYGVELRFDY